jgi:aminomethyltransferase
LGFDNPKPRLIEPGIIPFVPGIERYRTRGGGVNIITLDTGDKIELTDIEGQQCCEVVVLNPSGGEDFGALGLKSERRSSYLNALLSNDKEDSRIVAVTLRSCDVNPDFLHAVEFFGGNSSAGETTLLVAERKVICIVVTSSVPMRVNEQTPPTDIGIIVTRATVGPNTDRPLPVPLADPRLDIRVNRATAESYEVKAGEFIQVIDVSGRQCTDFIAFQRPDLDRGVERGIDATVTRSLMGAAYPGPGLFSKFFDQEMRPLVEIVRDTVGRHDAFLIACYAKYYEDMGYPGHANCSDNFNSVLSKYEITQRRGWPAINFFNNTQIDASNIVSIDEPWSRPGDYILLRALTDLVCSSSACPDDISSANGWNPTDIHVRVYEKSNVFSKSIAYRITPDEDPQLTRETSFHPRTSALTRNFSEYRGYWLPNNFVRHGTIREYYACREAAVIADLSALRKFEVLGPDAEELLQRTLTRDISRISIGQISYSAMCNEVGGTLDDGTLFRLGPDNFRWACGDEYSGIWLRKKAVEMGLRAWIKNSTDQLHNLAVQGPKSREILKEILWTPPSQPSLEELGWFHFAIGRIGNSDGTMLMVSRTGFTGELGYEVWCHPNDALVVWDAIWKVGEHYKLTPLGSEALDILRIEAGLVVGGQEFDEQVNPFEAGIGFTVALNSKSDIDFVGKPALIRHKEQPSRKLVGLELEGNEPAAPGDCVHISRSRVGVITSGTRSPILRKNIALCRMAIEYSNVGTYVEVGKIDGHLKRIPAIVVSFPFYDPDKARVRG